MDLERLEEGATQSHRDNLKRFAAAVRARAAVHLDLDPARPLPKLPDECVKLIFRYAHMFRRVEDVEWAVKIPLLICSSCWTHAPSRIFDDTGATVYSPSLDQYQLFVPHQKYHLWAAGKKTLLDDKREKLVTQVKVKEARAWQRMRREGVWDEEPVLRAQDAVDRNFAQIITLWEEIKERSEACEACEDLISELRNHQGRPRGPFH